MHSWCSLCVEIGQSQNKSICNGRRFSSFHVLASSFQVTSSLPGNGFSLFQTAIARYGPDSLRPSSETHLARASQRRLVCHCVRQTRRRDTSVSVRGESHKSSHQIALTRSGADFSASAFTRGSLVLSSWPDESGF